jgi:penicillin-binding protein 2
VFASFAPCNNPKLVVVVMLPDSGFGADAAAPAVRQIWDGIFGLEGKKAAMPGGNRPALPKLTATSVKADTSGKAGASAKPSTSAKASASGKGGGR